MIQWQWSKLRLNGWSTERQKGFEEVTPDAGSAFKREVFTDVSALRGGSIIFTQQEFRDFEDWYLSTINQGTIPFEIYDCLIGQNRTAYIYGKYTARTESDKIAVNFTFWLPPTVVEETSFWVDEDENFIVDETADNLIFITRKRA